MKKEKEREKKGEKGKKEGKEERKVWRTLNDVNLRDNDASGKYLKRTSPFYAQNNFTAIGKKNGGERRKNETGIGHLSNNSRDVEVYGVMDCAAAITILSIRDATGNCDDESREGKLRVKITRKCLRRGIELLEIPAEFIIDAMRARKRNRSLAQFMRIHAIDAIDYSNRLRQELFLTRHV
jgi:hypothetical protein